VLEQGFQTKLKSAGDYSCYFSTLIHIAELVTGFSFDLWTVLELCVQRGYVIYNFDNFSDFDNFTVQKPAQILELLTNKKWSFKKITGSKYKALKNEYVIRRFVLNQNNHFNMEDWDSLQNSKCAKEGKIESFRVFSME
jgi:hypothetical protein